MRVCVSSSAKVFQKPDLVIKIVSVPTWTQGCFIEMINLASPTTNQLFPGFHKLIMEFAGSLNNRPPHTNLSLGRIRVSTTLIKPSGG